RLLGPTRVDREVAALASHPDHARAVPDTVAQRLRELGQIALDPLRAGRVAGLGCGPAGRLQQTAGRGVRELRPRREEAYMAPLRDGRGGGVARFQDDRLQSALEQMGGGG